MKPKSMEERQQDSHSNSECCGRWKHWLWNHCHKSYVHKLSAPASRSPPFLVDADTLFSIQKRVGASYEASTLSYKSWKQISIHDEHLPNRNFSIFNCANFTTLSQACQHLWIKGRKSISTFHQFFVRNFTNWSIRKMHIPHPMSDRSEDKKEPSCDGSFLSDQRFIIHMALHSAAHLRHSSAHCWQCSSLNWAQPAAHSPQTVAHSWHISFACFAFMVIRQAASWQKPAHSSIMPIWFVLCATSGSCMQRTAHSWHAWKQRRQASIHFW